MAGPEKQRTKSNQSTKAFAKDYWASLMNRERQYFDSDLSAKKRKKASPKAKGTYSLEKGMTSLATRMKAAGLDYAQPLRAAQKEKSVNQKKKLRK